MTTMKPGSPDNDPAEMAVIKFFEKLTPGWVVERPAPSIERVSCYVLKAGSVHVTEYQGCSFTVYTPVTGAFGAKENYETVLRALKAMES